MLYSRISSEGRGKDCESQKVAFLLLQDSRESGACKGHLLLRRHNPALSIREEVCVLGFCMRAG